MATHSEGTAGMLEDGAIIIAAGRSRDLKMVGESQSRQVNQDVLDAFGQTFKRRSGGRGSKGDGGLFGTVEDLYNMNRFFKSRNVSIYGLHTLTHGVEENARDNILRELKTFFESQRLGFVLYFSGHGNQHGDWVLGKQSVLTFSDVYDMFVLRCCSPGNRAMQKLLVIADCCCSGQWVQSLKAKRRQRGCSEDAARIFIQTACRGNQETKDIEAGGFFTKLYSEPALMKLHNRATIDHLSQKEQSWEDSLIERLEGQVPDASIPGLTFVVNIGDGIGVTKCWWALCQEDLDGRPSTMPLQPSPGEGAAEDAQKLTAAPGEDITELKRQPVPEQAPAEDDLVEEASKASAATGIIAGCEEISVDALMELASMMSSQAECTRFAAKLKFNSIEVLKWKKSKDPVDDIAQDILLTWKARTSGTRKGTQSVLMSALLGIDRPDLAEFFKKKCYESV